MHFMAADKNMFSIDGTAKKHIINANVINAFGINRRKKLENLHPNPFLTSIKKDMNQTSIYAIDTQYASVTIEPKIMPIIIPEIIVADVQIVALNINFVSPMLCHIVPTVFESNCAHKLNDKSWNGIIASIHWLPNIIKIISLPAKKKKPDKEKLKIARKSNSLRYFS